MNASGACSAALNTCYARECNRTRYGAIAYGAQSGAYGWSNDLDDAQAAEKAAMAHCSAHGDDCQVVVDFWNTCAAVAAYRSIVAYGLGATRARAEEQAVTSCTRDAGAPCEVQAWSCTKP